MYNYFLNEIPSNYLKVNDFLTILEFSDYDYDLFWEIKWKVLTRWIKNTKKKQKQQQSNDKSRNALTPSLEDENDCIRQKILGCGIKCFKNTYFLNLEEKFFPDLVSNYHHHK